MSLPSTNVRPTLMSSREIASLTGKKHAHVARDIRVMLVELECYERADAIIPESERHRRAEYIHQHASRLMHELFGDDPSLDHLRNRGFTWTQDARGYVTEFMLTRELTETLLTGYSIPLRHKVILRWRELEEAAAKGSLPGTGNPKIDEIAQSLRLGLISKEEAAARTRAILDHGAPFTAPSAPVTRRRMALEHKPAFPFAEPSGASVWNVGDYEMEAREVAHWVKGGYPTLMKALKAGRFIDNAGRPTPEGRHLFGRQRRGRDPILKVRSTLQAIGAWPAGH